MLYKANNVLSLPLKAVTVSSDLMSKGRAFKSFGNAYVKDRYVKELTYWLFIKSRYLLCPTTKRLKRVYLWCILLLFVSVVYEHRARLERSLQKEKTDHKNTKLG